MVKFDHKQVIIGLLLACMLTTAGAITTEANCKKEDHSDKRNFCLAMVKEDVTYCSRVVSSDIKNLCKAIRLHKVHYCYRLNDEIFKDFCLKYYE